MARFDLYETRSARIPFLVEVQSDLFDELRSRVVIPLTPASRADTPAVPRLHPMIMIEDKPYYLVTSEITTVPLQSLHTRVGNIQAEHRDTITAAMDFLFQGY